MDIQDITFGRIYTSIKRQLQKWYKVADSNFDLSSPMGMILRTVADLYQLNKVNISNSKRVYDLNDPFNDNNKAIRSLSRLGQYNPQRGIASNGSLRLKLKSNIDAMDEAEGNYILFNNGMRMLNKENNLEYCLKLSSNTKTMSLVNDSSIVLNVVQGGYKEITFTGTGEINQAYVVPFVSGREIDDKDIEVYVNSELWSRKKHKFDMIENDKAYVAYTSFSGGVDIIFGNGHEGKIPPIGSEILVVYLVHDGSDGNIANYETNDFEFIDIPTNEHGEDIDVDEIIDIILETDIKFGTNGDTKEDLKQILPYATPNFVLSGVEQYKYFLKRLKVFSTIDVFTSDKRDSDIKYDIYELLKKNTELLNRINESDNTDTLKNIVRDNLKEVELLRKLYISNGTENMINILLIPDIKNVFGNDKKLNYFNVDLEHFILTDDDKNRIMNYLFQDGIQTISNEVRIIDPNIKKYAINVTVQLFEKVSENDVINDITNKVSDYFLDEMRRDIIPTSDIIRLIDGEVEGVDSVSVEFISEDNEKYHREYLKKRKDYYEKNGKYPRSEDIRVGGKSYDKYKTVGLDTKLGNIVFDKDEYPIIRGGFVDRYGNMYSTQPGDTMFSPINILILPERTKGK